MQEHSEIQGPGACFYGRRKMGFQLLGHSVFPLSEWTKTITLCPSLTLPSLSQEGFFSNVTG